jgi:hypothetical protein
MLKGELSCWLTIAAKAQFNLIVRFGLKWAYDSLSLRMAAITRGLRCPCITDITQSGFSSGA